jgi:MtrB/PioB family decaheme-associated outer membrane protein
MAMTTHDQLIKLATGAVLVLLAHGVGLAAEADAPAAAEAAAPPAAGTAPAEAAATEAVTEDDAEAEEDAPPPEPRLLIGHLDLGIGYVSDDSYAFGRYTGLEQQGPFLVGDVFLKFAPGRPDYLHVHGHNLGLSSRSILIDYGRQGRYDTFIEYEQLPSFKVDSAQTPYDGVGTGELTLAPFRPLELETERKRLDAGFAYHLSPHLHVSLAVRRETKDGVDAIGGSLAGGGGGGGVGSGLGYAALLPEPIDYVTHQADLKLGYVRQRYQWELAYHLSLFDNDQASLSWDNPAAVGGGTGGGGGAGLPPQGRLALPPSNQFHQFTLSGAYGLSDTSRLTGLLSAGVMLQDESFLPYRVGDPVSDLPRTSLDGEVYVYAARLGWHARPRPALRLNARYSYDERDNQTPQADYSAYYRQDGDDQPALGSPLYNQPLSYRKHKLDLDADYRFTARVKGGLGYEYRQAEREFSDVEDNQEHDLEGRLKLKPLDTMELTLKAGRMERDASEYQAESPNQNPLLRKYYLADETQKRVGASLSYMPHPTLAVGLSGDWRRDDYDDTLVGLSEASRDSYTLDLSYVPREDLTFYGFYSREELEATQFGADTGGAPNWRAEFDDGIDTLGAGVKIGSIRGKLDLGLDYVYMQGDSDIALFDGASPVTSQYPTLENRLHSIRVYGLYHLRKDLGLHLSWWYEDFESTDWALDGYAPDSVGNTLLLGNDSPDYDNHVVTASLRYRF